MLANNSVIADADFKEIKPKSPSTSASSEHVLNGIPITKTNRIRLFSANDWEEFLEEWTTSLHDTYKDVRRFGGSGDFGIDVVGFCSDDRSLHGIWDNFQCKHLDHPLYPSDMWVEIAKIIYYSHRGEYVAPRRYYFVASQGIGTSAEKLLRSPDTLKRDTKSNWEKHCQNKITSTSDILLVDEFLDYFDQFDFSIFSSKSVIELIDGHSKTGFHAVRFGGGLPPRPDPEAPPLEPASLESRYLRQILDAYGQHFDTVFADEKALNTNLKQDYSRQRERFYYAEALRNFARDNVPSGTFDALQDEVFHGVIDVCQRGHSSGMERMKATLTHASQLAITANPLARVIYVQDRLGICHQLANDDRLKWVPENE